jgi:hypothetical protein
MTDAEGKPRPSPNRPSWFDKWRCLENFLYVFKNHDISLIADGVDDLVWKKLQSIEFDLDLHRTNFGHNAGSFLYCLDMACNLPETTIVYFVEDDYIHHEGADIILEQGIARSAYVSLYDHPDKYWGENAHKVCNVFITDDCHWRTTSSTTMTFATTVRHAKEDRNTFQQWCGGNDNWTHDFQLFTELANKKGLSTPIPGYASHMDTWVIGRLVDWQDCLRRTSNGI